MGIGPFQSFVFPGVYTQTINEAPTATAAGDIRVPAFIGIADEVNTVTNLEMIRGSSSFADNPIVKENVSNQVTGSNRNFQVSFYPIVTGSGNGVTTTNPNDVTAYINGDPVPVASVDGVNGIVYLVNIPAMDDEVLISYYFKETDTLITGEDLSNQANSVRKVFKVHNVPIVDGSNGGIVTTDRTKVSVSVSSPSGVTVTAVDGADGLITLSAAPASGALVLVTYYTNIYQNTADILPAPAVVSLDKVGLAPGTTDFVPGVDFALDATQYHSSFSTVQWGESYSIAVGTFTPGSTPFDSSKFTFQQLYDNKDYRRAITDSTSLVDGTNATFTLETRPVDGVGRGIVTDDPSKFPAVSGATLGSELSFGLVGANPAGAVDATVIAVNGLQNQIIFQTAPTAGTKVFATQYANRLVEDTWTITCVNPGTGASDGTFSVVGTNSGTALNVMFDAADSSTATISLAAIPYPAGTGFGNSDAQVNPSFHPITEKVSLTFIDTTSYHVTSSDSTGTGSIGDSTGYLRQTYVDRKTGFRITLEPPASDAWAAADHLVYQVTPVFSTGATTSTPSLGIPGMRFTVGNLTGVHATDTAILKTYALTGNEPKVGDFYYVSFTETKSQLETPLMFTLERDLLSYTGPLSITNKLGMAGHLAFLNGAQAVVVYQIPRTVGGADAPASAYIAGIDAFNDPMTGGLRPALMEPMTTATQVLNYLKTSNIIQSGIRYQNERMSYFGFPVGTSPTTAQTYARSMSSERMIAIYPDGGITTLTDYLGNSVEYLVDGAFLAAAVSGRDVSPAFDVATPMTNKPVVGFDRLYRRLDSVTAAQTANSGITLLQEVAAGINIRIDLTTDLTSVLTRQPSVIRIKDFVQRGSRNVLQSYIGQKFLIEKLGQIEKTLSSYLASLKQAQIIADYSGVKATQDPNDPTIVRVVAFYSPVLPLLWIVITFNLRSS